MVCKLCNFSNRQAAEEPDMDVQKQRFSSEGTVVAGGRSGSNPDRALPPTHAVMSVGSKGQYVAENVTMHVELAPISCVGC
jgi:hypothetical protein